jgi:hypothetical protein
MVATFQTQAESRFHGIIDTEPKETQRRAAISSAFTFGVFAIYAAAKELSSYLLNNPIPAAPIRRIVFNVLHHDAVTYVDSEREVTVDVPRPKDRNPLTKVSAGELTAYWQEAGTGTIFNVSTR